MAKKKIEAEEVIPHTVTKEDLNINPELADAGIQVGEEIDLPAVDEQLAQSDARNGASEEADFEKTKNDMKAVLDAQPKV
jgi:hypothetical protein